jgi:hypothetical protein
MAEQNEVVMQYRFEQAKTGGTIGKEIGQRVEVPIEFDFSDALKEVQKLKKAFGELDKIILENSQVMDRFDDATREAAAELERAIPKAKRLAKELAAGEVGALKELDELEVKLNKVAKAAENKLGAAIQGAITPATLPALKSYVAESRRGLQASKRLQEAQTIVQSTDPRISDVMRKNATAEVGVEQRAIADIQQSVMKSYTALKKAFGDNTEEAKQFIKVLKEAVTAGKSYQQILEDIQKVGGAGDSRVAEGAKKTLAQLNEVRKLYGSKRGEIEAARTAREVEAKAQARLIAGGKGSPTGGSATVNNPTGGSLAGVKVEANSEELLASIRAILRGEKAVFTVKVGANPKFLLDSIKTVLKTAEGLKVNIAGKVTEVQAAKAVTATTAGGDRLAGQARARQLRLDAVANPLTTVQRLNDDALSGIFASVQAAKGSGNQKTLKDALGYRDSIMASLNSAIQDEGLSKDVRSQLNAVAKSLDANLFRPLRDELAEIGRAARQKAADQKRLQAKNQREADQYEREFQDLVRQERADKRKADAKMNREEREARSAAYQARVTASRARELDTKEAQKARRIALDKMEGKDPRAFVAAKAGSALRDYDDLIKNFNVVNSTDANVKLGDKARALELGRAAAARFNARIEQMIDASVTEARAASLKAIKIKTQSKFETPLRNNKAIERAVDAETVWRQVAQQMQSEVTRFASERMNFGRQGGNGRISQESQQKLLTEAFKDYQRQVLAFEKLQTRMSLARTTQEQDQQLKLLDIARKKLRIAEDELKVRALENSGDVNTKLFDMVGGGFTRKQRVGKDVAYLNLTAGLNKALQGDFDTVSGKLGGITQEQFRKGLFASGPNDIQKEFLRAKGVSAEILQDNVKLTKELEKHIGPLRDAYNLQSRLSDEIREQIAAAALRNKQEEKRGTMAGFGNVIRNAAAAFGGFGLGYTAAFQIRQSIQEYAQFEQEIAGIQGVLSGRDRGAAQRLSGGVQNAAVKYGQSLLEAAKAARVFAQAGLDADQTVRQLNIAFAAQKAIGLPLQQVQELQLAVRAVTESNDRFNLSLDYTSLVLEKISAVESTFAVSGQDLADGLKILSPILEQFAGDVAGTADVFDITNALITTAVQRLRISGTQAANAIKFILSRIVRPEIGKQLQEKFGMKLGDETGKNLLPLNELIPALAKRYNEILKQDGTAKAAQFANVISGGRQSNVLLAILQEQDQYFTALNRSAEAYAGIEERAAIATETLSTAVGRVNASFDAFIANLMQSSGVGKGTIVILRGLASALQGLSGSGGFGSTLGTLGSIATIGGSIQLLKSAYLGLSTASTAAAAGTRTLATGAGALARIGSGFTTFATWMARLFTPGGTILLGITAAVAGIGAIFSLTEEGIERTSIKAKTLKELKAEETPAATRLRELGVAAGAQPGQFNLGFQTTAEVDGFVKRFAQNGDVQKALQMIPQELRAFDQSSQEAFAKFGRENPELMKKFADQVTTIFRKELPESARKGFDDIKTQALKVGTVQEIIGSAATLANLQIADSIEQIRVRTKELIDEATSGLNEIQNRNFFEKMIGKGDLNLTIGVGLGVTAAKQTQNIQDVLGSNLDNTALGPLVRSQAFQNILRRTVESVYAANGQMSADRVVSEALLASRYDPATKDLVRAALDPKFASKLVTPGSRAPDTNGQLTVATATKLIKEAEKDTIADTAAGKPGDTTVAIREALAKLEKGLQLSANGLSGEFLQLETDADRGKRALREFRDALVSEVLGAFQDIQRFRTDEQFASQFGTGFDRAGGLENLGRSLFQRAGNFEQNTLAEIVRTQSQRQDLVGQRDELVKQNGPARDIAVLDRKIASLRDNLLDSVNNTLPSILPDTEETRKIIAEFKEEFAKEGMSDNGSILNLFRRLGASYYQQGQGMRAENADQLLEAETRLQVLEKEKELSNALLPVNAKLEDRTRMRAIFARKDYDEQVKKLYVEFAAGNMSEQALDTAKKRLDIQYLVNEAYAAQIQLATAERALQEQAIANLQSMTSGVMSLMNDTSIWGQLFEDMNPETRWKSKMQALGRIALATISPFFKTVSDRFAAALQEKLVEKLMNIGPIAEMAQLGEIRLKQDLQFATDYLKTSQYHITGLDAVLKNHVQQLYAVMAGLPLPEAGKLPTGPEIQIGKDRQVAEALKISKKQYGQAIGIFGGQILGTIAGKGGQGAQQGASIGSTAGTLGAAGLAKILGVSALGGPVGLVIGGLAGGLLGGLFGGKADKKDDNTDEQQPVVQGLEALERRQVETIQTIQAQTDALLKPESRLLNLPSTFNVPNYMPNFGSGGGGGGGDTVINNPRYEFNIDGGNPEEVRRVVEEALADSMGSVLANQRRSQRW